MKDLGLVAFVICLVLLFFFDVTNKQVAEKKYCDGNNSFYAYSGRTYGCPNYKGQ